MAVTCVQSASREQGGHKGDARRACVRGANRKHSRHACDAGSVEDQRLVKCRRVLPRVRVRARARARVRIIGLGLGLGLG